VLLLGVFSNIRPSFYRCLSERKSGRSSPEEELLVFAVKNGLVSEGEQLLKFFRLQNWVFRRRSTTGVTPP
jgi:hypothetical protein